MALYTTIYQFWSFRWLFIRNITFLVPIVAFLMPLISKRVDLTYDKKKRLPVVDKMGYQHSIRSFLNFRYLTYDKKKKQRLPVVDKLGYQHSIRSFLNFR